MILFYVLCVFLGIPPKKNPSLRRKSSYFYIFLGSHKNSFMYMKVPIFVGSNEVQKYPFSFRP